MKNLITITSLVAAAAMTSTAFAENITIANDGTYEVSTAETVSASEKLYFNISNDKHSAALNINDGGTLTIEGETVTGNTDGSSVSLGWAGTAVINVESNGTFNMLNAGGFGTEFGHLDLNIAAGGIVNLLALKLTTAYNHNATSTVNVSGTLNLGSGGYQQLSSGSNYTTDKSYFNLTLENGSTLGALADWSSTGAIATEGNVTINTTKYDATAGNSTTEGATISLSGDITSKGTITVSGAGTLNLSGGNVSLSSAISNLGSITVDTSTTFDLSLLSGVDNVYTIIDGGTITNWGSLTATNFNRGGNAIADRQTLTVGENGTVTISGMLDLTWAGTEGNSAWVIGSGDNWTNNSDAQSTHFEAGDSVTFTSDATSKTVSIANGTTIAVGNMTVASGTYTFNSGTTGDMATIAGNTLAVSSGATMNVGADGHKLNLDFNDIQLAGTINLKTNEGVTNIKWNQVTFNGGKIHIDDIGNDLTIDKVVMTGAGSITQNWGAPVILNLITGSGDLTLGKATREEKEYRIYGFDNYSGKLTLGGNTTFSASIVGDSAMKSLEINGVSANVNFKKASGESTTTYNVSGDIVMKNNNNGTANRVITIDEGVIVKATKFDNGWGCKTLTVNGTLNLDEIRNSSGNMVNTITGSGTINVGKLAISNAGQYLFDGDITVNIGADGIVKDTQTQIYSEMRLQIKNATIGASADWSFDSNIGDERIKLGTGAEFNTNGHTITINNVLSNMSGAAGKITKLGEGTLVLGGANTFTGGVTINAGTVQAGNASALGTGAVTVSSGANLQAATGLTFSAETQTLTLKVSNAQKSSGAELITSSASGSVTISDAARVLIDISGLDLSGTEDVALHIAVDSALDANSSSFEVGEWNNDSQWIKDTSWFVSSYDSNSGIVTLSGAVPEPSMFGLLAGLGALALVGARRRRKTK